MMIRNYGENAFLESSGIAFLLNLILNVYPFDFILPSSFAIYHKFSAILEMQIIPNFWDVQRI